MAGTENQGQGTQQQGPEESRVFEPSAAFAAQATDDEIVGFTRALGKVAAMAGLVDGGYRLISNCGVNGGQEVPHYHVHLLGGGPVGRMVCRPS